MPDAARFFPRAGSCHFEPLGTSIGTRKSTQPYIGTMLKMIIVVTGKDKEQLQRQITEVVKLMNDGLLSAAGNNEEAGFEFSIKEKEISTGAA